MSKILLLSGYDEKIGRYFTLDPCRDPRRTAADPTNHDTTDFPRKGCRNCGKRDRPQFKGECNDGHCGVP